MCLGGSRKKKKADPSEMQLPELQAILSNTSQGYLKQPFW